MNKSLERADFFKLLKTFPGPLTHSASYDTVRKIVSARLQDYSVSEVEGGAFIKSETSSDDLLWGTLNILLQHYGIVPCVSKLI